MTNSAARNRDGRTTAEILASDPDCNLARLFTKISSGGENDGYATIPEPKKAKKEVAKAGGINAGTLGKAARSAFFKR